MLQRLSLKNNNHANSNNDINFSKKALNQHESPNKTLKKSPTDKKYL